MLIRHKDHRGQIYRATGWEYDGLSKPERAYFIGEKMVSRKCGPKTRTHEEMIALGAECKGSVAKHRFKMVRVDTHNSKANVFSSRARVAEDSGSARARTLF